MSGDSDESAVLGARLRAKGRLAVYTCGKLSALCGFSLNSGYKSQNSIAQPESIHKQVQAARSLADAILEQINHIIVGKEQSVRMALACLLARGHLLIEDVPGVGKTMLAHTLAKVLGPSYGFEPCNCKRYSQQLDITAVVRCGRMKFCIGGLVKWWRSGT